MTQTTRDSDHTMLLAVSVLATQGLIFTAGSIYRILHFLNIPINVQEVSQTDIAV